MDGARAEIQSLNILSFIPRCTVPVASSFGWTAGWLQIFSSSFGFCHEITGRQRRIVRRLQKGRIRCAFVCFFGEEVFNCYLEFEFHRRVYLILPLFKLCISNVDGSISSLTGQELGDFLFWLLTDQSVACLQKSFVALDVPLPQSLPPVEVSIDTLVFAPLFFLCKIATRFESQRPLGSLGQKL